jgi:hypothetical protein
MNEKQIKNLIKAMVLNTHYEGIEPSYSAYGDSWQAMDYEYKNMVEEIYSTFETLEEYDEEKVS